MKYQIYAVNTGSWGPDELYGQPDRPKFETLEEAQREVAELAKVCDAAGAPAGLAYGIEVIHNEE